MIVYREFSSLVADLGFSGKTLYSVSNHISRHYRPIQIPKGNGEVRQLYVPDELLKAIQKNINEKLLPLEEISPYATAYRPGGSTKWNAAPHVGAPVLLKLDIRQFFDHLIYPLIKEKAFPAERYSEQNRVLLALLCTYQDALPQGAPTSPAISNLILRDFDNALGAWCQANAIAYSRYCDDMTFSGEFEPRVVIDKVKRELKPLGLFLNEGKTVVLRSGQRQCVTGIVVNERLAIPADYKRQLRQELYYCMKFGIRSHLEVTNTGETPEHCRLRLLGKVHYILSVEPHNEQMKKYQLWLTHAL